MGGVVKEKKGRTDENCVKKKNGVEDCIGVEDCDSMEDCDGVMTATVWKTNFVLK